MLVIDFKPTLTFVQILSQLVIIDPFKSFAHMSLTWIIASDSLYDSPLTKSTGRDVSRTIKTLSVMIWSRRLVLFQKMSIVHCETLGETFWHVLRGDARSWTGRPGENRSNTDGRTEMCTGQGWKGKIMMAEAGRGPSILATSFCCVSKVEWQSKEMLFFLQVKLPCLWYRSRPGKMWGQNIAIYNE